MISICSYICHFYVPFPCSTVTEYFVLVLRVAFSMLMPGSNFIRFYPRDAVLARILAMTLCLSVCLCLSVSVTSRCSIVMVEQIELDFGTGLLSTYPRLCYKEMPVSPKTGVLPSENLS